MALLACRTSRACICHISRPLASTSKLSRVHISTSEGLDGSQTEAGQLDRSPASAGSLSSTDLPFTDAVDVFQPGLSQKSSWQDARMADDYLYPQNWSKRAPEDQVYWWQRSILSQPERDNAKREEKTRIKAERRAMLARKRRETMTRKLENVYHAAKQFPMGDRTETLAAIDDEFLERTPETAPLPVDIYALMWDASNASYGDNAKGLLTPAKEPARTQLFDKLDRRRLADEVRLKDTLSQYLAYVGKGMHGRRAAARAARIFDALHGTSELGRPRPKLDDMLGARVQPAARDGP